MNIVVHPRVRSYLNESGEKERLVGHLKQLAEDPFNSRSGVDKKKLKGKKHHMYRLRVGEHRFEYFVEEDVVWVDNAFKRGWGYR